MNRQSEQQGRQARPSAGTAGFTLIELVVVVTIIGVLAGIAMPMYQGMRERAQIGAAISEIASLQQEIVEFRILNDRMPVDLNEIGRGAERDPWGNEYVYLDHSTTPSGQWRTDRFNVPVNTDYDLYSRGADQASSPQFTAAQARDDIARANDSGWIGLAETF